MKLSEIINPQEFVDRINQKLPPRQWISGYVIIAEGYSGINMLPSYIMGAKNACITSNVGWWATTDKVASTMSADRVLKQVLNIVSILNINEETEFELLNG